MKKDGTEATTQKADQTRIEFVGSSSVVVPSSSPDPSFGISRRRWRALFLAFTGVIYLWLCTDRSWKLFQEQDFGNIFDHLAISMVHGRLDLPPGVIGTEAFIIEGRYYGYWAPFPAVLRLPLALTGSTFWVGHTARLMCWIAGMLTVWASGRILGELSGLYRWPRHSSWFVLAYLAAVAYGTHIPYLVAGPSVYHESVLWGSATALLALQLGLVFLRTRRYGPLLGAVLMAGAAGLTRPTSGYGALIGTTGLLVLFWWNHGPEQRGAPPGPTNWRGITLVGLTAMFLFLPLLYNHVRFGSWVRLPYDKHPGVEAWRVEITKHGNFQPVNLWPNARSYFDPTHIDVRPGFPYFHLAAYQAQPGAQIEHAEAYAGIPAFMTGLCILAVLGLQGIPRDKRVVILLAGGGASLGALLAFTAVAHRYEHDLFPWMVLLSAGGVLWLEQRKGGVPGLARVLLTILLGIGIWQSAAFTFYEQEWARRWEAQNPYQVSPPPSHHE